MKTMQKKWIIYDGELLMGMVEFHRELVKDIDNKKVAGGGMYEIDENKNTIYFYGSSLEYNGATEEELRNAKCGLLRIKRMNWIFSTREYFSQVLKDMEYEKK